MCLLKDRQPVLCVSEKIQLFFVEIGIWLEDVYARYTTVLLIVEVVESIQRENCSISRKRLFYVNMSIKRRELKKQGLLSEDDFYRNLQANCDYIDEKTVRIFYMAVVKTITKELRDNKVARLPHLGDFALVPQKPKILLAGNRREFRAVNVLKFYPKPAWREYFSTLDKSA